MCIQDNGQWHTERLVLGMKKPPRTRRHEGEVSVCSCQVAVTVYCPPDKYIGNGWVIIYLTLNHFFVIPAPYTARFEYIGGYFECVNDYPVSLGHP